MKIAMVLLGGLHPSGEREVVPSLLALFERLARSHDVHAFALRHLHHPQSYPLRGFTVHDLGRSSAPFGLTRTAMELALVRELESNGPFDLIHGFWADPAGQLAARAAARLSVPSIVTCDGGEFVSLPTIEYGSQRTARGRQAVREACSLATKVHVCTRFMAGLAQSRGYDTTVIPLTSVTGDSTRPRAASRATAWRLVQVASASRVKNQRLLLDALPLVRARANVHLDLVGEDTLNGELQRYCSSIGMEPYVTFHGFQPQARVHEILASADIYVQSSLHEAAGVSVLEAAAHGLPTVGTSVGFVADWSGELAVAVENATAQSLADAIASLAGDEERQHSIGSNARRFALDHDADAAAAALDQLYLDVR